MDSVEIAVLGGELLCVPEGEVIGGLTPQPEDFEKTSGHAQGLAQGLPRRKRPRYNCTGREGFDEAGGEPVAPHSDLLQIAREQTILQMARSGELFPGGRFLRTAASAQRPPCKEVEF